MDESTPTGYLLIVDDEDGIRSALRMLFADLHYHVTDDSSLGDGHKRKSTSISFL